MLCIAMTDDEERQTDARYDRQKDRRLFNIGKPTDSVTIDR